MMNSTVDTPLDPMDRYIAAILNLSPDTVLNGASAASHSLVSRIRRNAPILVGAICAAALAATAAAVWSINRDRPALSEKPSPASEMPRAMVTMVDAAPPKRPASAPGLEAAERPSFTLPSSLKPAAPPAAAPKQEQVQQMAYAEPVARSERADAKADQASPSSQSSVEPSSSPLPVSVVKQERRDTIDALNIIRQR